MPLSIPVAIFLSTVAFFPLNTLVTSPIAARFFLRLASDHWRRYSAAAAVLFSCYVMCYGVCITFGRREWWGGHNTLCGFSHGSRRSPERFAPGFKWSILNPDIINGGEARGSVRSRFPPVFGASPFRNRSEIEAYLLFRGLGADSKGRPLLTAHRSRSINLKSRKLTLNKQNAALAGVAELWNDLAVFFIPGVFSHFHRTAGPPIGTAAALGQCRMPNSQPNWWQKEDPIPARRSGWTGLAAATQHSSPSRAGWVSLFFLDRGGLMLGRTDRSC